MLQDQTIRSAKSDEVAAKIVDGEAILINLMSGVYYTTDGVGAEIWSFLERGASIESVSAALAERHGIARERVREDVHRLVEEMSAEGLIVTSDGAPPAADRGDGGFRAAAYEAPSLVKYDDMADMFALDPPLPELPPVTRAERT